MPAGNGGWTEYENFTVAPVVVMASLPWSTSHAAVVSASAAYARTTPHTAPPAMLSTRPWGEASTFGELVALRLDWWIVAWVHVEEFRFVAVGMSTEQAVTAPDVCRFER